MRARPHDVYDSVKMVGHNNIFVYLNWGEFVGYLPPPFFYHKPSAIQPHLVFHYFAEHVFSVLYANRNEIPTIL